MKAADYIANFLNRKGVTDTFGIPGGVILDLLYAMERTQGITPHLCYHEQGAAFAAAGYGQWGAVPGVAFATCGPGITNTLTAVADAYADSTPMLVFTAHAHPKPENQQANARFYYNQEMDIVPIFASVTKACVCVDMLSQLQNAVEMAYAETMTGRKGPVVVDILSSLFNQEMPETQSAALTVPLPADAESIADDILRHIDASKRPLLLLGEGVKLAGMSEGVALFAKKNGIPVLTSRYAQDIMPQSELYFGYIGTHAIRAANFILSKADLIIALGNRLAFPVQSQSFRPLVKRTKILRVDIDPAEFERKMPNSIDYCANLAEILPELVHRSHAKVSRDDWLEVCRTLRAELAGYDAPEPVQRIAEVLHEADAEYAVTSDVGNNEMWLSRAYDLAGVKNRILYSKTFGALGCSMPKAVGVQYASKRPVICFTGDQGLQMNVQELQTIASNKLPILIVVLNNRSSGMIREHEEARYGAHHLLTTEESGYTPIDVKKIAEAYGIPYRAWPALNEEERTNVMRNVTGPMMLEIPFADGYSVTPQLKRGDPCQKLFPYLDETLYQTLDAL